MDGNALLEVRDEALAHRCVFIASTAAMERAESPWKRPGDFLLVTFYKLCMEIRGSSELWAE